MKKIILLGFIFFSLKSKAQLTSLLVTTADTVLYCMNPSTGDSIQLTKLPRTIYSGMGTGTSYTLTATSAQVILGSTSPAIIIARAGTYLMLFNLRIDYNGATLAVNRSVGYKVRRVNNTATDIFTGLAFTTPITTLLTSGGPDISRQFIYTASAGDSVQVYSNISGLPSLGSVNISEANIIALRLY